MKKQRIVWIDWAKTILIYLMVVGHCLPVEWQSTLIYAFHMPAFFVISGYLYHQHHWKKTVKTLVIPVVFFSMINMVIYTVPKVIKGSFSTEHLIERVLVPFWGPGSLLSDEYIILFPGVWFIIALLLGRLLMGDFTIMSWVSRYWKIVFIVLISFLSIEPYFFPHNPLHFYKWYLVIPSLPFILLGYGMRNKMKLNGFKPWMVILLFMLFIVISLGYGRAEILNCQYGNSYLVYFLNAVVGSVVLFYVCRMFPKRSTIEILSKGTLLVMAFNFVLHTYICALLSKIGLEAFANDIFIAPWIIALLIMIICYYPIKWLLNHYPSLLGK
jgi:fucose 4-O-acetylase-like acetyltransferase